MKAKSRKRLLISSIAMLLVAMLALGTATFAWFTQNTTAYANDINVKAVKSSNLVVSKETGDTGWDTTINYGLGSSESANRFFPTSSTNGTNWVKAIGTSATDGAKTTAEPTPVTLSAMGATTNSYVFYSMLNVKNDTDEGGAAINNVTIKWDALGSYARIALVPADSTGAALTTGTGVGSKGLGFANNVYANNTTQYTAIGGAAVTTTLAITPDNATSINIGNFAAGDAKYFLLYVWFEGQDPECIDNNAGQVVNLNFEVTGTPE